MNGTKKVAVTDKVHYEVYFEVEEGRFARWEHANHLRPGETVPYRFTTPEYAVELLRSEHQRGVVPELRDGIKRVRIVKISTETVADYSPERFGLCAVAQGSK